MLFYIIEAVAVYSVINKYPNDADAAVSGLRALVCFGDPPASALYKI